MPISIRRRAFLRHYAMLISFAAAAISLSWLSMMRHLRFIFALPHLFACHYCLDSIAA